MLRSHTVFAGAWRHTTGSAQPTVPLRAIRELPVPVPPLEQQRAVVRQLNHLLDRHHQLMCDQKQCGIELNALLPSILDRAFKGDL